jgi:hypothetical protein
MDISKLENARRSYLPEIMEKLEKDAPVSDLQRLIALEMASILKECDRLTNSIKPDQVNLRERQTRRALQYLRHESRGVRMLGMYIKQMHKRRDDIDWNGRKFTYVMNELVKLAVECLKKTGQSEHVIRNWAMHYDQQLDERFEEMCRAANKL